MARQLPPGEAPMSGRVQRRSTGMLSGSSSCPRACSSLCREVTGHWRSAMPSAAGARLRWTDPLLMISSGPGCGSGPGPGDSPPGPHGIFRRTWSGRDRRMSWRPTGTRSASRRSHRPPQGSAHLSCGAVHSVLGYWTTKSPVPATVVMPTGTGKTETMLALLVAARLPRLLVLVPSDVLRDAGCGQVRVPRRTAGARCREQHGAASGGRTRCPRTERTGRRDLRSPRPAT